MTDPNRTGHAREGAEAVADGLRRALALHGLELPELGLHFPAVMAGYEVISLGTVSADTALQLTRVLSAAASA
jgi:hypothetical protein